jgi:hypothetical protein
MKPILQALLLADHVYEDKSTGKKIISGTFNQIMLNTNPPPMVEGPDGVKRPQAQRGSDPGCPSAYISVTDVIDGTELQLQFVNVSTNQQVFECNIKIAAKDRLAVHEIVMPLFPWSVMLGGQAGTYSLDVLCQGELLGSHRLLVTKTDAAAANSNQPN